MNILCGTHDDWKDGKNLKVDLEITGKVPRYLISFNQDFWIRNLGFCSRTYKLYYIAYIWYSLLTAIVRYKTRLWVIFGNTWESIWTKFYFPFSYSAIYIARIGEGKITIFVLDLLSTLGLTHFTNLSLGWLTLRHLPKDSKTLNPSFSDYPGELLAAINL